MSDNPYLVLVSGKSATGKSACLRNLKDPEGVMYMCTENNKALPFRNKFRVGYVQDPMQVYDAIASAEDKTDIHTIVIDSLTYLMEMFETQYVLTRPPKETMKAWSDYAQYFRVLMKDYVGPSTKNIIFTAHTSDVFNEDEKIMETLVKVKGSLMNQGIESRFTNVISTKKVNLNMLKDVQNDMLTITPKEEARKFKYVFQTDVTADTMNERIRGPMGMWDDNELYIDNDIQLVLDRLHEYYHA